MREAVGPMIAQRSRRRGASRWVAAFLLLAVLAGCSSGPSAAPVVSFVTSSPAGSAAGSGSAAAGSAAVGTADPSAAAARPRSVTGADGIAQVVPAAPERVVTLSEPTLDGALALGVTPIGTIAARGQAGVASYLADRADGVPLVGVVAQPNLEAIAAQLPDLILVDGTSINNNPSMIELLRAIAPTVVTGYAGGDWRDNLSVTAQSLGRTEQAQQVLLDYELRVVDIAGRLGANSDAEISVVRAQGNGFSLILKELPPGLVLTDLGLRRPPAQDLEGRGHSEPVSNESLDFIDGDWMFFGTLGGSSVGSPDSGGAADTAAADAAVAEAAATVPGFTQLRAYQNGHIVPVDGSAWTSAGGPLLINTILDDIERTLASPA